MTQIIPQIEWPLFREFILSRNSKLTQLAYFKDLQTFFNFIGGESIEAVRVAHVIAYREVLKKRYSGNYTNRKLAALKAYFHFLIIHQAISYNPTQSVTCVGQISYKPIRGASDEEVNKILEACGDLRHGCILNVLFFMGLRRSEICDLTVGSIRLEGGVPTLNVVGKGSKQRTLKIPEHVFQMLTRYLVGRTVTNDCDPLFIGQLGGRMSPSSIAFILKKYADIAGVDDISPHVARVSAVTSALENGASLKSVKEMGGWSNLEMVLRYDRRRVNLNDSAISKVNYKK